MGSNKNLSSLIIYDLLLALWIFVGILFYMAFPWVRLFGNMA